MRQHAARWIFVDKNILLPLRSVASHSELVMPEQLKMYLMPRPKIAEDDQLKHLLRIRVNAAVYQRLTKLQKESDCRSVCEIGRKILSQERFTCFYKDTTMNGPMEELALIRKELKPSASISISRHATFISRRMPSSGSGM